MRIRATVTAACLAAVLAVAGCAPADGGYGLAIEADRGSGDVELTACAVDDQLHWPAATVRITNHSATTSNYVVQVAFLDGAGRQITEGVAAASSLAPAQDALEQAQGTADPQGPVSCRVVDIARYATP
ncbi:FxLYD domain-containing protein [Kitasatospora sp. NPDC004531]